MTTLTPFVRTGKNVYAMGTAAMEAEIAKSGETDAGRILDVRQFGARGNPRASSPLFKRSERIEAQYDEGGFSSQERSRVERQASEDAFSREAAFSRENALRREAPNRPRMFESNYDVHLAADKVGAQGNVPARRIGTEVEIGSMVSAREAAAVRRAAQRRPMFAHEMQSDMQRSEMQSEVRELQRLDQ